MEILVKSGKKILFDQKINYFESKPTDKIDPIVLNYLKIWTHFIEYFVRFTKKQIK